MILSKIQSFFYAGVAEITNVIIGSVKSRLFWALRSLRAGLWRCGISDRYVPEGYVSEPA